MVKTIEVTVEVEDILGELEMGDLLEEVCSRGGVAAEDWGALLAEGETGEIVEWLEREGYTVANADDDVVIVPKASLALLLAAVKVAENLIAELTEEK